jgi:hypothetical protein
MPAIRDLNCGSVRTLTDAWQSRRQAWWPQRREASLNWLALGVLLAAWNASQDGTTAQAARRPEGLRGYSPVSVRAATLHGSKPPNVRAGP